MASPLRQDVIAETLGSCAWSLALLEREVGELGVNGYRTQAFCYRRQMSFNQKNRILAVIGQDSYT